MLSGGWSLRAKVKVNFNWGCPEFSQEVEEILNGGAWIGSVFGV